MSENLEQSNQSNKSNELQDLKTNQKDWQNEIDAAVKKYPIMVFMRGTHNAPRCGFSARVMTVLQNEKYLGKKYGVDFGTEDMDADRELWNTLKKLNNWPTSPQIYVNGEFIGGCDIFVEMYKSGELEKMLQEKASFSTSKD